MIYDQAFGVIPVYIDTAKRPHFLLVQKSTGDWGFPKGHAERNESPQKTAERELKEETNIVCAILKDITFTEKYYIPKDKKTGEEVHKEVTYFLGTIITTDVTVKGSGGEIINYLWLPYETAFQKITFPEGKKILTEAFEYLLNTTL